MTKTLQYLMIALRNNVAMKFFAYFFLFWSVKADVIEDYIYKEAIIVVRECKSHSLLVCLKEKALNYIQRLPNNFDIANGITIKQNESDRLSRQYTQITLPDEDDARETILDKALVESITSYLSSHTLEFKLPSSPVQDIQTPSVGEARRKGYGGGYKGGKKGKKGGLMPLMMMFYLKTATMGAIALKAIGMIAFKALLIAKVALTIATIVGLKKLSEQKSHNSYEVITHPHHEDWGHYDRAFAQEIAYKGHKKEE